MKCSQLAYLQTAPTVHGSVLPRLRPRGLTTEALLDQCRYIYGDKIATTAGVAAFNVRFGGLSPQSKGASKVLFLRFSDDPWQPVQPNVSMGGELPLVETDDPQGSCAHCGAGCTRADMERLDVVKVKTLREWLQLS